MKDIVICGAGGFAEEVTLLIRRINDITPTWNFLGYIDKDNKNKGQLLQYGAILGDISYVNNLKKPISVALAIGKSDIIKRIMGEITNKDIDFPNLIDPSVLFLDKGSVKIGIGNIICANSVISCNVKIGDNNVINIGTGIGHESIIGNYNVIMPNVNISGGVKIGNENMLGVKSTVLQYLKIGNQVKLGANSLLMKNTKDGMLYLGTPAKKMEL